MMCTLYIRTAVCQNACVRLKQCQTVKKSLAFIDLCLSEGISESVVSQAVEIPMSILNPQ